MARGDCGFARLKRMMCDFVDDLDSENRERWVCVLVLGIEVVDSGGGSGCDCDCGYGQW